MRRLFKLSRINVLQCLEMSHIQGVSLGHRRSHVPQCLEMSHFQGWSGGHQFSDVPQCLGMSHFQGVSLGHRGVTWRWRWVGIARRELERESDSKSEAGGRKSAQAEHTTIAIGALLFLVLASLEFPTRSYRLVVAVSFAQRG